MPRYPGMHDELVLTDHIPSGLASVRANGRHAASFILVRQPPKEEGIGLAEVYRLRDDASHRRRSFPDDRSIRPR